MRVKKNIHPREGDEKKKSPPLSNEEKITPWQTSYIGWKSNGASLNGQTLPLAFGDTINCPFDKAS